MNVWKLMIKLLQILVAVAAIGAAAQLSISLDNNISAVPITAQSLVVLLIARLLPWRSALASVLIYLLLGTIGLPLFSDFSSGLSVLKGPSLGYLIGFLIATLIVAKIAEKAIPSFLNYLKEFLIGTAVILICGGIGLLRYMDLGSALSKGILPYLPGGLIKILIGAILLAVFSKVRSLLKRESST